MSARPMALAVAAVVFAASCSSDDTSTSVAGTSTVSTTSIVPSTESPESSATVASSAAATTAPGTDSPVDRDPLPVPTVALTEVGHFDHPVEVTHRRGDDRLFVVEQTGRVLAIDDTTATSVLEIGDRVVDGGEQGLLGLAFHPTDDLAYVHYSDLTGRTVLAEYAIDSQTADFDLDSERIVLTVDQPFANHNGGELLFGPDELLYLGLGDGGSADDPLRAALDLGSPLGKILRVDPLETPVAPFSVPGDNPFVAVDGADARVWAYGLRNPWKFSFDSASGDLWIADVGQRSVEEINHAPATSGLDAGRGANFGWSAFEGLDRFNDDQVAEDATAPVFTYSHDGGNCSISGGAVARTDDDLAGWYVFGDFCTGNVWGLDTTRGTSEPRVVELANVPALAAIAEGPGGMLYAVSNSGPVLRLSGVHP